MLQLRGVSKPVSVRVSVLSPDVGTGQARRSSGWTHSLFVLVLFFYTHLASSLCISLL